jgi:hypothetical protein
MLLSEGVLITPIAKERFICLLSIQTALVFKENSEETIMSMSHSPIEILVFGLGGMSSMILSKRYLRLF